MISEDAPQSPQEIFWNPICRQCRTEIEKRQELIETDRHYFHVWCWELLAMEELRKNNTAYSDTTSLEKQGEIMSEETTTVVDETPNTSLWSKVKKPLKWVGIAAGGAILGAVAVLASRKATDDALVAGYEIGLIESRSEDDSENSED